MPKDSIFSKSKEYFRNKLENLRSAPTHVQRTATTALAAATTVAIVGMALLLQATIGNPSEPQLAASAGSEGVSLWRAFSDLFSLIGSSSEN